VDDSQLNIIESFIFDYAENQQFVSDILHSVTFSQKLKHDWTVNLIQHDFKPPKTIPLDVIIVGGGPIGQLTSIVLKKLGVENVHILEKRTADTRTNIVSLRPPAIQLLRDLEVYKSLFDTTSGKGKIYKIDSIELGFIAIRDLQKELQEFASSLSVSNTRAEVTNCVLEGKKCKVMYSSETQLCDLLVAADGAHSSTREKLGIKFISKSPTGYGMTWVGNNPNHSPKYFNETWKNYEIRIFATKLQIYVAIGCGKSDCKEFLSKFGDNAKERSQIFTEVLRKNYLEISEIPSPNFLHYQICTADKYALVNSDGACAVLIGDAARTTSFFSGSGINVGINSIEHLEKFVKSHYIDRSPSAIISYNNANNISSSEMERVGLQFFPDKKSNEDNGTATQIAD